MKPFLIALALILAFPGIAAVAVAAAVDTSALIRQGDALDARLENKQALEVYLAAEKAQPANAEILHRISRQYALMMDDVNSAAEKRQMGEKALDFANRAVAADGKNAQAQLSLAICYGRLAPSVDNKTKIAYSKLVKEHAETSLALDPNDDLTYHVLGAWNYEVTSLNPLLRALAKVIYGDIPSASYEKALENFKKAVHLNPKRLANHVELGRTYAALGKKDEARAELKRSLEMPVREKDDAESKRRAHEALGKL